MKLTWRIFKNDRRKKPVFVYTNSFDAALAIARKIDPTFCAGQPATIKRNNKNLLTSS